MPALDLITAPPEMAVCKLVDAISLVSCKAPPSLPDELRRGKQAGVVKLADARDSKSRGVHPPCGFDSHLRQPSLFEGTRRLSRRSAQREGGPPSRATRAT